MIEVSAGKILSGRLTRAAQQRFAFTYLPDVSAEASASLPMPVRAESWTFVWGLPPIFQMNLPEGTLRLHLENLLTKAVPDFDDLELLHVTGQSHIGCLRYGTPGSEIDAPPAAVSVQGILTYDGPRI